jgi:hypothetical protein
MSATMASMPRRDLTHLDRRLVPRQQLGMALEDDRLDRPSHHRQIINRSGSLHTRKRADALEQGVPSR